MLYYFIYVYNKLEDICEINPSNNKIISEYINYLDIYHSLYIYAMTESDERG